MKSTNKMAAKLIVVGFIVFFILIGLGAVQNYQKKQNPIKPTITVSVHETGITPQKFMKEHPEIMSIAESFLFRVHRWPEDSAGEQKWKENYRYVFVIKYDTESRRKAAAEFNRKAYLQYHPKDGVDTKLIFSDQLPDPEVFDIIW